MLTIKKGYVKNLKSLEIYSYDGKLCFLSSERYILLKDLTSSINYKKGTVVRLISGVDESKIPSYHFFSDYLTVCRENLKTAEFLGVETKYLRKLI